MMSTNTISPQQDRADLVPAVRAHGEDQRRADAARAHKAEHGRVAQVHVEAVDDRGGEVRRQLGQDAITDLLEGRAARGVQRLQDPLVKVLDALDEHFRHHANRAEGHGQQSRERPGAGDANEHQSVDEGGDGADGGDEHAADQCHARGTRLLADRNDRGSEITAPTIVPRKAMQKVSSSR